MLFGSYRKTEQTAASRSMLFSNATGDPVCLQAESTTGARNKDEIDLLRSYISYTLQILLTGRGSISHILNIVNEYCRVAGVLRFTVATDKSVRLRRVI